MIVLKIDAGQEASRALRAIKGVVRQHPGPHDLRLEVPPQRTLDLGPGYRVSCDPVAIAALSEYGQVSAPA